jgi:hypothetical protein
MPSEWVPGRPLPRLRVFFISLAVLFLCLLGMLFGVQLEAIVPATGIIIARDLQAVRARIGGLVEPGWYQGQIEANGQSITVRLDAEGNGVSDPSAGPIRSIRHEELKTGEVRPVILNRQFHLLRPGDVLWPGQPLASIGNSTTRTPDSAPCWLVLEVLVSPLQQVNAGDVLARIVPADPQTHEPLDLVARLDVDERHWAAVKVGAEVRLACALHNPRLVGHAEARIDRLEPWGEPGPDKNRQFHALAPITKAPFPMPLGSSFHAEISIGRKPVYRIILEH